MIQKHRISTNIGRDQKVTVELKQDYDLLEILSLKFTQVDAYSSMCSDYGVVVGRISVNNGFGVPNARISIFIPITEEDSNDPVISALYPFTTVTDKNEDGYRYNLLPSRQQHGGHAPTGTFPDQKDVLNREEILEVYEKYYKYTTKTNDAGDFMIWGVPLGTQTIHVDVDLSDISCFSLRPDDFIRQGMGVDSFKNEYTYKGSQDIDSLPQIVSFNQTIEVYPFWGNEDLCEIGITRTDFDLSDKGVRIEPKAYILGGTFADTGKSSVNKNCTPRKKMGRKCDLESRKGKIEAIRFSSKKDNKFRPILENVDINEDIDEDGSFILPVVMNMDYQFTNEFGENEYTNDPNKGIPTSACYRFRFSLSDDGMERVRRNADYLVPNIREYSDSNLNTDKSYAFSTNYDDYPTHAVNNYILNNTDGFYYPEDYFYRVTFNKVYTVSSFQGSYFKGSTFTRDRFLGLKELVPSEEEDCSGSAVTPPVNFGFKNYTFQLLIADVLLLFEHLINLFTFFLTNVVAYFLHGLADGVNFWPIRRLSVRIRRGAYSFQNATQRKLYLINYPECEECNGESEFGTSLGGGVVDYCSVGEVDITGTSDELNRVLVVSNDIYYPTNPYTPPTCTGSTLIWDTDQNISANNFISTQTNYVLVYTTGGTVNVIELNPSGSEYFTITNEYDATDPLNLILTGYSLTFTDNLGIFSDTNGGIPFSCLIKDKNEPVSSSSSTTAIEGGCDLYDVPYNENIVDTYYVGTGSGRVGYTYSTLPPGSDVSATKLSDQGNYYLPTGYEGDTYTPNTLGGATEFSNGVFYYTPGTQTATRIFDILKEYRRRKRVGTMFCGGIVNYSFIDNWLSGSLYFFLFKAKVRWDNEEELDLNVARTNYCEDLVYFKVSESVSGTAVKRFYYRSTKSSGLGVFTGQRYTPSVQRLPVPIDGDEQIRLGHPTTMVDLGPRDEFIKEICTDPTLDPNCSVVRSIGPTSFQSFGELLGLVINYRLDTEANDEFSLNEFFDNDGFNKSGYGKKVLDGDILQLISINNEVGIEEFNLQSPKYLGYSYQKLDPETYPAVFKNGTSVWGPTPITLELDLDGQRVRVCLNEPGRLTESSQNIPFFLWDKKGTGFGPYNDATKDNQSWEYRYIESQPLQGMTYGYTLTGGTNDPSDKYLLLPMTYTFSGLTITGDTTDFVEFDVVSTTPLTIPGIYDDQYPGFTYLHVTSGTIASPISGTLYTRYGTAGTWHTLSWNNTMDFIIRKTQDYYSSQKQILSTPFQFYFGLRPGNTGVDKFIKRFGPLGAFPSAE
jgi:hypothetical protein